MVDESRGFDENEFAEVVPERWETAIEDLAQVVAMGLDRAQDLADVLNDLWRTQPVLTRAVLAAIGGAVVGGLIAGRRRRTVRVVQVAPAPVAPPPVDRTTEIARVVAALLADGLAARAGGQPCMGSANGRTSSSRAADVGQLRSLAQLVPLALELLRNPLIRDLLVRSAARAARR